MLQCNTSALSPFWTDPTRLSDALNRPETTPKYSPIFASYKTSEFFKKSPLSGAEKYPDFQVTSCLRFVTTNVNFAYIESE